jgi:hypothetical protein
MAQHSRESLQAEKQHGWIVDGYPDRDVVRFIRDGANGPEVSYDVTLLKGQDGALSEPQDRTLNADELAQYNARTLAVKNVDRPCGDNYNTVVLKDPQGDGWIVWVLAATTDPRAVVLAGHYRFMISRSGRSITEKDALSHSCLISTNSAPAGTTTKGVSVAHFVSLTPIETQVFTSLSYKMPVYVGTMDGKMWKVDQTNITNVEDDSPGADGMVTRGFAGQGEICKPIFSKPIDGTPKFFIGGDVKVISATEHADKFAVPAPDGATVASIICGRQTIVPSPNDYKVVLAGYSLDIVDRGVGRSERRGTLEMSDGQLRFHIAKGDPLTPDLQAKVDARLSEMQAASQTAH